MGPFVPDIISDELNLLVALVIGIGFGAVLEQAGFSSSRKLAGVFYGYDFTVLRVFFTAAVTAMTGILLLGHFGLLDTTVIYRNPTWLSPALVGGAIMGLGFILGGYCPGTSICALAIGKVDALFFVLGGIGGVFIFAEGFPLVKTFYESGAMGPQLVYDSIGTSRSLFASGLIAAAIGAFVATTWIERRTNPEAPSRTFSPRAHRLAASGILALGLVTAILPDRKESVISTVSDPTYQKDHPVAVTSADECAFRIVDGGFQLLLVDLRPPGDYAALALPFSTNMTLDDLFGRVQGGGFANRHTRKIIVGNSEQEERLAALVMLQLGYQNISILEGGFRGFSAAVLSDSCAPTDAGRWTDDVVQFRKSAREHITGLINAGKAKLQMHAPAEKKIQGGC